MSLRAVIAYASFAAMPLSLAASFYTPPFEAMLITNELTATFGLDAEVVRPHVEARFRPNIGFAISSCVPWMLFAVLRRWVSPSRDAGACERLAWVVAIAGVVGSFGIGTAVELARASRVAPVLASSIGIDHGAMFMPVQRSMHAIWPLRMTINALPFVMLALTCIENLLARWHRQSHTDGPD